MRFGHAQQLTNLTHREIFEPVALVRPGSRWHPTPYSRRSAGDVLLLSNSDRIDSLRRAVRFPRIEDATPRGGPKNVRSADPISGFAFRPDRRIGVLSC